MSDPGESSRISKLLGLASGGDAEALGKVFEAAYPELRALASSRLRGRGPTQDGLQTTMLVHETFMRFAQLGELQAEHRAQFFRYAGHVMRSVIVDTVRKRLAQRRGSGAQHVSLTTSDENANVMGGEEQILRVHDALEALADTDPRLVDVVQLRYFGGMTDAEIAAALGITDRTVRRDWEKARLLLSEALSVNEAPDE
jgi:RNA polymerase sigma factor (TIGR02999 family)